MLRRHFVRSSATAAAACSLFPRLRAAAGPAPTRYADHPRLFIAADNSGGLQSVDDFRQAIKAGGFLTETWDKMQAQAFAETKTPPLQPDDMVPGRYPSFAQERNLDFEICFHAGARLNRHALVHLVTGDEACRDAALAQLRAWFDPDQWPDWIDQAHMRFGHPADLRTGMLSQDAGIAYSWLYHSLDESTRAEIREGIDRRGIQPFLTSVDQKAWWTEDLNNWITVIAGGVGIAAMAMHGEHPQAQEIIDYATSKFEDYLATYGARGEFNESVGYAGANRIPVGYFNALRFATGGAVDRLSQWPFPEMCEWVMHGTLDHDLPVPFGDTWPEHKVMTGYVAAVAAADQNPVLQHYFLENRNSKRTHPMNLLYFDARLQPEPRVGRTPLAIAYQEHGGMIVSRTSWDEERTDCIVFSKFGREENHEHNDLGQVGFNALGERLIVDLGSPPGYPGDFFEPDTRWLYYNASVRGHNVLMFGGREQRSVARQRGEPIHVKHLSGKLAHWHHHPDHGAAWRMDLTPAYDGVRRVVRTVLHLWPGYVLVFDEAELEQSEDISLRWHTIDQAEPDAAGRFVVRNGDAACTGLVTSLGADINLARRHHRYEAPHDKMRNGDLLEQRHESYIEASLAGDRCRLLTLFASGEAAAFGDKLGWKKDPHDRWIFDGPHGPVMAQITKDTAILFAQKAGRTIAAPLH
jgi:hypothetical protein